MKAHITSLRVISTSALTIKVLLLTLLLSCSSKIYAATNIDLDPGNYLGAPATTAAGLPNQGINTSFLASFEVTDTFPSITSLNADFRISYQLFDAENDSSLSDALFITNGDPIHPTLPNQIAYSDSFNVDITTFSIVIPPNLPKPSSVIHNFLAAPVPDTGSNPIDPKKTYYVRATLQRSDDSGDTWNDVTFIIFPFVFPRSANAPERQIFTFENTTSADIEYNIQGRISDLSWDQTYIVDPDPANDSFTASVNVSAARYDNFNSILNTSVSTTFTLDFNLIEVGSGTSIPLVNDGIFTDTISPFSYLSSGGNRYPRDITSLLSFPSSFELTPDNTQLKNGSETYELRCTLSHVEAPGNVMATDQTCTLAAEPLMHFNGEILFSGFQAEFSRIDNLPPFGTQVPGGSPPFINTSIEIADGDGILPDRNDLTFGNGAPISVRLGDDGVARFLSGTQPVRLKTGTFTDPIMADFGSTKLTYDGVQLGGGGAVASGIRAELPQGLIYLPDCVNDPYMGDSFWYDSLASLTVNSELVPSSINIGFSGDEGFCDEAHPIVFKTSFMNIFGNGDFSFVLTNARYIHSDAYATLSTLVVEPTGPTTNNLNLNIKPSNDRYLLNVAVNDPNALILADPTDGSSRLTADLKVGSTTFETHFPDKTKISFNNDSQFFISKGVPGGTLDTAPNVVVPYYQTCPDDTCSETVPPVNIQLDTLTNAFDITPSGGIASEGSYGAAGAELFWGVRGFNGPDPIYAHRTEAFFSGEFFMPGYQLYAADNERLTNPIYISSAGDDSASALLLQGFDRKTFEVNTSGGSDYNNGIGSYAGLNYIVEGTTFQGASQLAGATTPYAYTLLDNQGQDFGGSKYYTRRAGVSGRQAADVNTLPSSPLDIHGFETKVTRYQLTFIDNDNDSDLGDTQSWVDGNISVSGNYCEWDQNFFALTFNCLGEPSGLTPDLSGPNNTKGLQYWNSEFELLSLGFLLDQVLDPVTMAPVCPAKFNCKLAAGAKLRVGNIEKDLFGTLGFCPSSNLSTAADADDFGGIDSQINIPANIPLEADNAPYNLVPSSKLRFNNPTVTGAPDSIDDGGPGGFITFACTIDIPYFEDLNVQAISNASENATQMFLTPGFEDSNTNTFFDSDDFDPDHRGFPLVGSGVSYENFRQPTDSTPTQYFLAAQQKLFGLVDLNYPLTWNDTTRQFRSRKEISQDILVGEMTHKVDWLDAKFANISFGATYDGLPQLKISNWLNDELDGFSSAVSNQLSTLPKQAIDKGLEKLDELLEDSLVALIDPIIDSAETPICGIYDAISFAHSTSADYPAFKAKVNDFILMGGPDFSTVIQNPLSTEICKLSDISGDAGTLIIDLRSAVEDIVKGIDAINQGIDGTLENPTFNVVAPDSPDISGLLSLDDQNQPEIVKSLVQLLLTELVEPEVKSIIEPLLLDATAALNQELNMLLSDVTPTLVKISSALDQVRTVLIVVHGKLDDAAEITTKIEGILNKAKNPGGAIDDIIMPVRERISQEFLRIEAELGISTAAAGTAEYTAFITDLDKEAFIQLIKDELKDAILSSEIVVSTKALVRQTFYDLADKVTAALQNVLTEATNVVKQIISSTIGEIEEQINPLIGEVNKYMGSGEITGYAEINGDSLRKLRLDAKMQFNIPEEMALNVYLEILVYTSEDNFVESGCIKPGEKTVEVRVGAQDVAIEWISDIKISLEVKMTLKDFPGDSFDFPVPIGVAGTFEMTDGELDFQTFKVLEFGATMAVGLEECYIGAKARAIFSSYEVAAGIFFGRTCTLEPILFVDPDIGDVVKGGTTFTGAYVYGEVWLPISELVLGVPASCLFRIDAGIGAGAFYFVEGPTFGGKMFLGVSGEALCLVSIKGEVKMILASQAGSLRGAGTGKFSAKAGWCPFCIKFSKSVKIKYDNGSWAID